MIRILREFTNRNYQIGDVVNIDGRVYKTYPFDYDKSWTPSKKFKIVNVIKANERNPSYSEYEIEDLEDKSHYYSTGIPIQDD